ncbi:M14 family metallopeptidase [Paenibacillus tarimensis]|uniref:M14 family metallopeptidase n=1 Tax=Paenibacillus tarimensis TaxID=416012 RepID=UPI001F3EFF83|nr:M14 family metallocarboxypeptidase [Paenibacillus tarimensis]MCF2943570.1 M14 family metallocarboxypeptidase [Paenibacillus tarimensis]
MLSLYQAKRGLIMLMCFLLFISIMPFSGSAAAAYIVNPKQTYTYKIMVRDLKKLEQAYPELIKTHSLGKSEYGRDIWAVDLGRGPAVMMLNGSHHAREWITTILLMTMVDRYAQAYVRDTTWNGYSVRELLDHVTFRIIPMVNPDGVTLQQQGLSAFPAADHAALLKMNGGSRNFKRWKANAKGIDLNRQYPAGWTSIRNPAPRPYYMNYKGVKPLQAKEAQVMAEATLAASPELALAYHSSGEIVYWHFHTKPASVARDKALVRRYSTMTGYRIVAPSANPSGGGYTDWFISTFDRPGMTPELARPAGEVHVPLTEWDRIWRQHQNTGWMLAAEGYKLWMGRQQAVQADHELRLTRTERASKWPQLKSAKLDIVYPGRYEVLRVKGDWAEIATASGSRWISTGAAVQGTFEILQDTWLEVSPTTGLYASPLDRLPTAARLSRQTVQAMERWQDWYLIPTYRGAFWVKESEVKAVSTPEPANQPDEQPDPPTPAGQSEAQPLPLPPDQKPEATQPTS